MVKESTTLRRVLFPTIVFELLVVGLFFGSTTDQPFSPRQENLKGKVYSSGNNSLVYQTHPITLKRDQHHYSTTSSFEWPETVIVKKITPQIVNGQAKNLHHIFFVNTSKSQPNCLNYPGELFFPNSKELGTFGVPEGYGYLLKKGDKIIVDMEIANPDHQVLDNFSFKANFEFEAPNQNTKLVDLIYLLECFEGTTFYIPPASSNFVKKSQKPFVSDFSGTLLAVVGHLHNWGQSLTLFHNGKPIAVARPELTKYGEVIRIPGIATNLKIKKGDIFSTTAVYKNPTNDLIDGMSIVILFVQKDQ